jgi:hypothetical protein
MGTLSIVWAEPELSGFQIDHVDHVVQIRNGGLIVVNDTFRLSAVNKTFTLSSFRLGFPYIYRQNLDHVCAYDDSNDKLKVTRDVGLGKTGFYGVEVKLNIENRKDYQFTVTFVFSNLITSSVKEADRISFNATFPVYPSLTQNALEANLTITLPAGVDFVDSPAAEKGISFTNTTVGDFEIFNFTRQGLEPFAYDPFWFAFEGGNKDFIILEVEELKRDITVDGWKRVVVSDTYQIIPKASNLTELTIRLFQGAFEISAWDKYDRLFKKDNLKIEQGNATTPTSATLTFSPALTRDELAKFRLAYQVPWEEIIDQKDWQNYRITLSLFDGFDWTIRKLVVTLTLPEGAEFTHLQGRGELRKSVFQETLTFVSHNVTPFQDLSEEASYRYNVFWASFRPTLWVGTGVAVLSVLALLWRLPRPEAPIPTIPVKPEELKSYVDAYEEKRRSLRQIELLEEKARKGKIPRRRYKVRKRALESRLSVLSKDLTRLREKLRAASSKYADMMRRIEIAEAELEGIEAGIRHTEARYRRGEISTAAYHRLLEDYYRRRERARTIIDGVLIRLKEEIT